MKKMGRQEVKDFLNEVGKPEGRGLDPNDLLKEILKGAEHPGGDLAWLAAYDPSEEIHRLAFNLLYLATLEMGKRTLVTTRFIQEAKPILIEAVRDPGVSDDRKYVLGPIFDLFGGSKTNEEFFSYFKDFGATRLRFREKLASNISDQPEHQEKALRTTGLMFGKGERPPLEESFKAAMSMGGQLQSQNPSAAAALFGAMVAFYAEQKKTKKIIFLLEKIFATHCGRGAWCLEELSRWPAMGRMGRKAKELARAMKAKGLEPEAGLFKEFSKGQITSVDGVGSRSLALFFRTREGGLDGLVLLLNDQTGVKDAWCLFGKANGLVDFLGSVSGQSSKAPCTLDLARAYLADAWAIHEARGEPFPGKLFVYRPFFGEAPLLARRRKPDLSAYRLENMRLSPANFKKEAVRVLGHPAFDELWFASAEAYGLLNKFSYGGHQELTPEQFDDFVVRIFPLERHLLLSRMAANLEVEALAGRAEKNINRLAARMWLGISEEVMPLHEIPFIRSLCRQSAEKILYNLKLGFRNQAEANAVAVEKNGRPRLF